MNDIAAIALLTLLAASLACVAVAAWVKFCSGDDPL